MTKATEANHWKKSFLNDVFYKKREANSLPWYINKKSHFLANGFGMIIFDRDLKAYIDTNGSEREFIPIKNFANVF